MNKAAVLQDRAAMLAASRRFFAERSILEVDCNYLTRFPSIDAHIDLISALCCHTERRYLHTSPEYAIKRLLAEGLPDIYQLGHVFRDGEIGHRHQPEFTMAEWYRCGFSFQQMIDETLAYVQLLIGRRPTLQITYRELFRTTLDIDPINATIAELQQVVPNAPSFLETKDDFLNFLLTEFIEPTLLNNKTITVISHYPASQAALAQLTAIDNALVAERFEIFYENIELANGYHELANSSVQQSRFEEANELRNKMGKEVLAIDVQLLKALQSLPDCCGVAVGFDRLMMIRHQATEISHILPFAWDTI